MYTSLPRVVAAAASVPPFRRSRVNKPRQPRHTPIECSLMASLLSEEQYARLMAMDPTLRASFGTIPMTLDDLRVFLALPNDTLIQILNCYFPHLRITSCLLPTPPPHRATDDNTPTPTVTPFSQPMEVLPRPQQPPPDSFLDDETLDTLYACFPPTDTHPATP
jgi:hypothetical protein